MGSCRAVRLVAVCGTDLDPWRTARHFSSWLTLSPGCKASGGTVLFPTEAIGIVQDRRVRLRSDR
ncbi:transposase [Paraburkholderia sp. 32]|uniref:transposase n=1 Tax=unclassified Paraburkholderia TaxID=2615204 RepID=UPI003D231587